MAPSKRKAVVDETSSTSPIKKTKTPSKSSSASKRKAISNSEEKPSKTPKLDNEIQLITIPTTTSTNSRSKKTKTIVNNDINDTEDDSEKHVSTKKSTPRKEKAASSSTPPVNNTKKEKVTKKEVKQTINTNKVNVIVANHITELSPSHVLNEKVTLWEHYSSAFQLAFYNLSPAFIFAIFYFYILMTVTSNTVEKSTIAKSALVSCRTFIITLGVYAIAYLPSIILTNLFSKLVSK